jgi:hypothetical protein
MGGRKPAVGMRGGKDDYMGFPFNLRDPRLADIQACICLFLFVIIAGLATDPFFEMGVNDDWSYSQIAVGFAQTGRIAYGGWPASALLIQTPYGALLTKLFGGSFVTHRLGTLFLSGFIPILVYRLGLRFVLPREMAFFGAMTVGLSPLFIPHAVSFMTDSYGCLFLLAAIYTGVKSVAQTRPLTGAALFSLAMLLSFLGGMNRQAVWVTGPAIAGAYCFSTRKHYRHVLWGIALLTIFIGSCGLILSWLKQQPGFRYEMMNRQTLRLRPSELYLVVRAYGRLLLTTVVFAIPALSSGVALIRRRPAQVLLASLAAVAVFAATFWYTGLIFPYLMNVVTQYGLFWPGFFLPGRGPVILPTTVCRLVTAVALGLLFVLFVNWFSTASGVNEKSLRACPFSFRWDEVTTAAILIPVGSVAGYLFVLMGRAKDAGLFDRYSLPILPLLVLGILAVWQSCGLRSPGLAAWAVLILFGIYGVSITHDHFEQLRAQLRAVEMLEEAKVPRERILAGFEDDMWTQVALDGRLGSPGQVPPNSVHMWYLIHTPRIKPLYFLATSNVPHMFSCKFEPVHYSAWLSPRDRQLLILCPDP